MSDLVTIECARCRKPIETDMAPAGTLSFCTECAPMVRPGMYYSPEPADLVELIRDILLSFRGFAPPHIEADLCICVGPCNALVLKKLPTMDDGGVYWSSLPEAPPGAMAQFMGRWVYEVFDAGSHACYVRLGPPKKRDDHAL